ncbi:unnamed protein product [Penicillium viridicatum]
MSRQSSLPVESDLFGRRSLREKVEAAVCACLKEVNRIGITPWGGGGTFSKNNIKEITDNPELFDQAHIRKLNVKPCDCKCSPLCGYSIAWDEVVKKFRKDTLEYFDGKIRITRNVQLTKMVMAKIVVLSMANQAGISVSWGIVSMLARGDLEGKG